MKTNLELFVFITYALYVEIYGFQTYILVSNISKLFFINNYIKRTITNTFNYILKGTNLLHFEEKINDWL